ncbi:MAG TPA: DUF4388 domain-containing protein [Anaeromyxobacteraceae bacterium]|nr:DUF4388 domain-containing protein [Anaeromyxobacteraceae bacterium]
MSSPDHGWALLFVSGRYQGTLFALPGEGRVLLGRESDAELVLSEDLVSRRHAELAVADAEVTVRDLGSTNGTFVNGQRVKRAKLALGDRVLVGTSLMKLVPAPAGAQATPPAVVTRTRAQAALQGKLEEVPLPDLVQMVSSARKSGVLVLKRDEEEGRIDLREGRLAGCRLSSAPAVGDRKAFWRLLAWDGGAFELVPPPDPLPLATADEEVQALLMEGLRQLDEWRAQSAHLPRLDVRVEAALPMAPRLRDLGPGELDVLQAVLTGGTVQSILDRAPEPDVEVAKAIAGLIERGYVRAC